MSNPPPGSCSRQHGTVSVGGLVALLLAALVPGPALADDEEGQNPPDVPLGDSWRWVQFSTDSGLPSARVLDLVETTSGVPWAATDAGLAWFDGFRWRSVTAAAGLPADLVKSIAPDLRGGVLVVMEGTLYRGDQDGFDPIAVDDGTGAAAVRSAVPLDEEDLLVSTGTGLYRLGPAGTRAFPVPGGVQRSTSRLLGRSRSGVIWLDLPSGIYLLEGAQWTRLSEHSGGSVRMDEEIGLLSVNRSPEVNGLWTWSTAGRERPVRIAGDGRSHVAAMEVDGHGRAVVVYVSGQVRVRENGKWRWQEPIPRLLANPLFLRFQRNGDLWVGVETGLALFRGSSRRWRRCEFGGDVTANQVNEILPLAGGDVWIATSDGVVIHRADGRFDRIRSIGDTPLTVVTGLAEDRDGGIWVSSGSSIPGAFRLHHGGWRHYGVADGLLAQQVHRIVADREGRLWFLGISPEAGQAEPGAFVFDGSGFERWGESEGLLSGRVYAFAESRSGARWFGTNAGLSRWRDGAWTHWTDVNGLAFNRVFAVAVDHDDRVWFGHQTRACGLGFIDESGRVSYLGVADGLVNPFVVDVAAAPDGALWIGTRSGLSLYRDGTFASFTRESGLDHPRLWPVRPVEDRVYVGTIGGGVYVLDLGEQQTLPPVVTIAPPLQDGTTAFFRWNAFAHRGELAPAQIETRFRLDDGPWTPWGTSREGTILGISAGEHAITVQAKSLFGNIHPSPPITAFRVPPPFHRHPVVLAVGLVWLASMAGFAGVYWRKRRRHERLLRQREEHFRSLIENASDLISVIAEDGTVHYLSPSSRRMLGHDPHALVGTSIFDLVHPDDQRAVAALLERSSKTRADSRSSELMIRHASGDWRIHEATGRDIDSVGATRCTVLNSRDITERHRAQEAIAAQAVMERRLLTELDHRVRNNLASLISLIDLTRASSSDVKEFGAAIRSRTQAMVMMHSLLSGGRWQPVQLERLIESLVPPEVPGSVELSGHHIQVATTKTQALGIVVNELMTNSVKHGALGAWGGRVSVNWSARAEDGCEGDIIMTWKESGGPPVGVDPAAGVGSGLIRGIVESDLRGRADLVYHPSGVDHTLVLALDNEHATQSAGRPVRAGVV